MIKPDKVLIERIVFALLLLVFITNLLNLQKNTAKDMAAFATKQQSESSVDLHKLKTKLEKQPGKTAKEEESYGRSPLAKPMDILMLEKGRPSPPESATQAGVTDQEFILEGIVWGGNKRVAIISGEVVSEGEMIGSAEVVSIVDDRVIIKRGEKRIELIRR